jgi:hypothetical protein
MEITSKLRAERDTSPYTPSIPRGGLEAQGALEKLRWPEIDQLEGGICLRRPVKSSDAWELPRIERIRLGYGAMHVEIAGRSHRSRSTRSR